MGYYLGGRRNFGRNGTVGTVATRFLTHSSFIKFLDEGVKDKGGWNVDADEDAEGVEGNEVDAGPETRYGDEAVRDDEPVVDNLQTVRKSRNWNLISALFPTRILNNVV